MPSAFRVTRSRILWILGVTIVIVALGGTRLVRAQESQKRVLVLYALRSDGPAFATIEQVLRHDLGDALKGNLDYYYEVMDVARFTEARYLPAVSEFMHRKYEGVHFDLVIANSATTISFVAKYGAELFPDTPVVFNGGETRPVSNSTGFSTNLEMKRTIDLALQLQPGTRRVFVITGAAEFDHYYEALAREQFKALRRDLEINFLPPLPLAALLERVSHLPPDSVICFLAMSEDGAGAQFVWTDVVPEISRAANVPVYGWFGELLDHGILGGRLTSLERLSHATSALAVRVLRGERAAAIPIAYIDTTAFEVDWRQMRRWGLREDRLPAGTIVRFREPTIWEQYRWYIVGTLAVVTFQGLMIASLVIQKARQRQTQTALREGQERYALATAAGSVGVWDFNLETREFYIDPALKALLGYRDHEVKNDADEWMRLVHPDDEPALRASTREYLESSLPFFEREHRKLHRDGSTRWFLTRGSAVRLADRPVRIIGTDTDITERKRSAQALDEAQADVSRLARLTALGEFAASIAHEVRQPLAAILANAQAALLWLGRSTPEMGEARAAIADVVDAGRRADEVIQRNQALFRHQTVQTAPLQINRVIHDAVALSTARLQSSQVSLVTSLGDGLPAVIGDPIELQQVLLNLIANAIDAMEDVEPGARRINLSSSLTGDGMVTVLVSDRGVGLSGVDLQQMFKLSYTTKATGTGVGLSISRSIVAAHGGSLWAEQNPEQGATFGFTVPACPGPI